MRGQIIEKAKGVWLIRVQKRTSDGKRKSFSQIFRGSKTDAEKCLTKKLSDFDTGIIATQTKQTVDEYLDLWLETFAKPRLQLRTYVDYKDLLRLHVRDSLGKIRLVDLKAIHIQKHYARLQTEINLSPRRVRYVHAVLSSALKKATELDMVVRNVAKLVQLPKSVRKEMDVLDQSECICFLDATKGERQETMFSVALGTGLRPEEYLGLTWKDVDVENRSLVVRRVVVRVTGAGWAFAEPKTVGSRRLITLPTSLVAELRRHRRRQGEERLKLGPAWQDYDLVFPSEVGIPPTHSNITQIFKRVLRNAGLRSSLRLYDLRHSHATLLLTSRTFDDCFDP